MREGDEPLTARSIEKKAGTKLTMAGLIIELTNACKAATSVLEEAHQQNLYLQDKVDSLEQVKPSTVGDEEWIRRNKKDFV